jgi:hypothetical protein
MRLTGRGVSIGISRAMSKAISVAAISALMLVMAGQISAQPAPPEIPDAVARKMLELGLRNIHRGLCGGLNGCAPATPEEFQLPPLTLGHARIAIVAGTQSAVARWCGLDADRRSAAPTMRMVREKFKLNERQAALMAIIHGIQQSIVTEQLKAKGGECNAATRSKLDAQLPKS